MTPNRPVGVTVTYNGHQTYTTNITPHDTVEVVRSYDRVYDRESFAVVIGEGVVLRDHATGLPTGLEHEHLRVRCDFADEAERIAAAFLVIAFHGHKAGVSGRAA